MSSSGLKAADTPAESRTHDRREPEATTPDRNDRIREIAYFLWLDEGSSRRRGGAPLDHRRSHSLNSEPEQRKRIEGEPPGEPVHR